jgi:hypothetical protein
MKGTNMRDFYKKYKRVTGKYLLGGNCHTSEVFKVIPRDSGNTVYAVKKMSGLDCDML